MDEPLRARLVLALAATGRRAEALSAYRTACSRLADELGSLDSGPELRDAQRVVPRDAHATPAAGPDAGTPHQQAPVPRRAGPAQLPHDLPSFTGRRDELEEVLGALAGAVPRSPPGRC